jgi:ribonuclease HI
MMSPDYVIYMDGGCKANPGRLAVAAVVCSPEYEIIAESAREAGEGTNNVSEYRALAHAIGMANLLGARNPMFVSDSMLVVQQINGFWAMKGETDSPLALEHSRCYAGLLRFDHWWLKHVTRDKNKRADWLVSRFLEHERTLKKEPGIHPVEASGEGRPGWINLSSKRIIKEAVEKETA